MRDKPTRFYSKRQENMVAKAVGGKRVANSGASTWQKGDVQTERFLIECKTTIKPKQSFSIKQEWLEKIEEESIGMRKEGFALAFEFDAADNKRYYIISEQMFQLLNYFMEKEDENV